MSRLDDELRKAYRRQQPPDDFTARLLERVSRQPAPRARWWQRLATLLAPPKLRWVAIGVTASLLLAIGAAQYSKLNQVVQTENDKVANIEPPEERKTAQPAAPTPGGQLKPEKLAPASKPVHAAGSRSVNSRPATTRVRQEREMKAEGEAAKETLMYALSIASSALNDAQKAVHDDGLKP
jgi:hypothetical protein